MEEGKPSPAPKKAKAAAKPVFERQRGGEARAVSDLVPDIGRAAFRRFGFVQSSIVSRWDEIVGPRYADVSAPEMIRFPAGQKVGGTLELVVEGAHAVMIGGMFAGMLWAWLGALYRKNMNRKKVVL